MKGYVRFLASVLVSGIWLAGCGEPDPSVGFAPDIPDDGSQDSPVTDGSRTFTFTAADGLQKQDFLFVVDTSGSMGPEVALVRSRLNDLVTELNGRRDVHSQWAVTSTNAQRDQGRLYGVVTPEMANPLGAFDDLLAEVQRDIDDFASIPWSGYEMGLRSAELALKNHGGRFLRDGVPLAVVIVTDATDVSATCGVSFFGFVRCDYHSTQRYVDFFRNLKGPAGNPAKTLLYPLAASRGDECNSLEDDFEADWSRFGGRYGEVRSALGTGFSGSVCADRLGEDLSRIGREIAGRGICTDLPGGATEVIAVLVAGSPIQASPDTGYRFDAATGSLCFAGSYQPPPGAEVRVTYR